MNGFEVRGLTIAVPEQDIDELRDRFGRTRRQQPWPEPDWAAGTDDDTLQRLADHWADTLGLSVGTSERS